MDLRICLRKDKGYLKAKEVIACQKCYSHSLHDEGGNTLNVSLHLTLRQHQYYKY